MYLSCCKLKTEHPAPDSDLPVLGKGELSICPQCSLYHCVGTLLNPRSWVSQDLRSPLQSCSQTSHLSCTCAQSVPYWRQDFAYHQEVSESPISPLNGLTILSLAIFLAVLAQGAYYLWECQPACDSTQNHSPNGRKKAFSLFLKAEINQVICSIKRKLNNTRLRVSKLIPP